MHVIPAPPAIIQPFCKRVSSISINKLGAYSTAPIKLTKKGPLSDLQIDDGSILEDVEQIDTTLFKIDIVNEDGKPSTFTVIIPDP